MTGTGFCPRCGGAREGSLRFCRACGFDFEAQPTAQPADTRPYSERYAATAYGAAPPPASGVPSASPYLPAVALAISAGIVAVGSFLPWLTATIPFGGNVSRSGIEGGDGLLTVAVSAALVVAAVSAYLHPDRDRRALVVIVSIALGALVVFEYSNTQGRVADFGRQYPDYANLVSVGVGIWTMAIGSVGAVLSGLSMKRRTP